MGQRIRLGIVGLGRAAARMLPALAAHSEVSIAACADPNRAPREQFKAEFAGLAFETAEEMFADGNIDAAYIATPHQCHFHNVIAACNYRKHILVEKPMALSVADCVAMTDAARTASVILVVGPTHGSDPAVTLMRTLIESADYGALRMISNFAYTNFLYRPRRPEELDTSQGGGIFFNQVPHQIEIARSLARNPIRIVRAIAGRWDLSRPTEGAMGALLEFDNGVAASLIYSGYDHFDSDEFHFWVGEDGHEKHPEHGNACRALQNLDRSQELALRQARGYRGTRTSATTTPAHNPHLGVLIASCDGADLRPSADGVLVYDSRGRTEIPIPKARAYPNNDAVVDEFVDAIVGRKAPLHDGIWGTHTMVAALALLKSAQERREIAIRDLTY